MTIARSVIRFVDVMLEKLDENRHKDHWSGMSQKWLLNRLRQETGELSRAIKRGNATEIAREAADVSNFAMMIADNALEEEQREAT
jgi:NTP pyrophosphatase (non-canonical NTP hydrolase)